MDTDEISTAEFILYNHKLQTSHLLPLKKGLKFHPVEAANSTNPGSALFWTTGFLFF